ncbi:Palmitoyltransferase ZDHHC3 [Echinococcus granulosus]|uniref:Palmitoyltransferase n=1 Tax=Echinococcus granulosus TaxID=6210 RepID=A0A068WNT9_ECHGR|nr:Palmitoyltransferase ZDHHC3 [Echinococcus granulosus]CDS19282.1 palmitoyltransferase zdhhc3 [Echinococcus granulosus]
MNRFPFVRLAEGGSISSRKSESSHLQDSAMANNNSNHGVINYGASDRLADANGESDSAASGSTFPPVITAGSRYRGHKEVDINKWDEEASQHLLTMRRPPGDLCDCLSPWRRLCRLRYPPPPQKMAANVENGFPLPFGVVWFVRDCAGCVCMVFTWLLIAYGEFVVACIILPQLPSAVIAWIFGFIYHVFALLAVVSHLKAVFTDPGTVRLGNATRDAVMRIYLASGSNTPLVRCPKCLCIKPDRAHHCSCCRRCVRKMDHHCPWVNNCVGEGNQKFFVLFNLYIFLQSLAGLALIISFFFSCFSEFGTTCKNRLISSFGATNISSTSLPSTMLAIGAGFEAVLFGLFTVAIGGTQLCAICKDETAVESLKRNKGTPRPRISKRETLANVFGRPFSWRWFSPFHPPAPLTPVVPPPPQESEASEGVSDLEMQSAQQHQHRHEDHYDDIYLV